jgi:hypothetical protein
MAYRLMFIPPRVSYLRYLEDRRTVGADKQNPLLLRALQASLTVVFMTLALFFASGMYEEKIRYAHR